MSLGFGGGARERRRHERGQALIFFTMLISVLIGMAALAVDVGLWYSDRTVARNAADAASAAAARIHEPGVGVSIDSTTQAGNWTDDNHAVFLNATSGDCLNTSGAAVRVEVERASQRFFSRLFVGAGVQNVKATATGCVGSAQRLTRLLPVALVQPFDQISGANPQGCLSGTDVQFGSECDLYVWRSASGSLSQGWRRIIDLNQDPAAPCSAGNDDDDLDDNAEFGSGAPCRAVGGPAADSVFPEFHVPPGPPPNVQWDNFGIESHIDDLQDGLNDLLDTDGCDTSGNNSDEFDEVLLSIDDVFPAPPGGLLARRNCRGDRLMYLPALNALPGPGLGSGEAIEGFVPFFVLGCVHNGNPDPDCSASVGFDDSYAIRGVPVRLQEPIDAPVKGYDNYGTRRIFLSE